VADQATATLNATLGAAITAGSVLETTRAREPAIIERLIDRSKLTLENGVVKGVDAEITRLQTAFPGLFYSVGNIGGGARNESDPVPASPSAKMAGAYATNAAARTSDPRR